MMAATAIVSQLSGSPFFSSHKLLISPHLPNKTPFQFVKVRSRPIRYVFPIYRPVKCTANGRKGHQLLSSDGVYEKEPFWLSMVKDVAWSLRSLAIFLAEQPSQLKYIEWPTFSNTLKTATLTLVLVALLIVALSSVDSLLCYILALLLRKPA